MNDESQNDDPLAQTILQLLTEGEAEASIAPADAARAYAELKRKRNDPPDLWRRQLVPTCPLGEPETLFKLVICELGQALKGSSEANPLRRGAASVAP